ncbi:MAG: hypothetical protein G01um101429_475 [Parcubacteria group bacterium Gr01-1014_29]|nr:MAG: hypothetical protein G01um101429_475 [Parcubacteria group bacterium Gr01-1014_29]
MAEKIPPRVVVCDVGNVLFTFQDRREVIKRIIRAHDGDVESEKWFSGMLGRAVFDACDNGKITPRKLWKYVCKRAVINHRELSESMFFGLFFDHLQPIDGTITLVRRLQNRYPLVAVSDGDIGSRYAINALMTHHGVQFLETYVSCEKKLRKPALYAYAAENLLNKHNIAADECVCVDDIISHVNFVKELGMRGIHFNGAQEPAEVLLWRLGWEGIVLERA